MEAAETTIVADFLAEAERSVSYGEALDMKASIWLVIITFLATQTAYFLGKDLTRLEHHGQVLSAILLIIAGALVLAELRPQDYQIFEPSRTEEERLTELRNHYIKYEREDLVSTKFLEEQMKWAKERIIVNRRINEQKSRLVDWSFRFMALGTAINLLTLLHFVNVS
jgi:hypothetical protein